MKSYSRELLQILEPPQMIPLIIWKFQAFPRLVKKIMKNARFELKCFQEMIGALIGKKGKNIQNIQTQSRCKILVKDYPVENGGQYIAIEGILKTIILQTFLKKTCV